jgi:hypothetical protein
LPREYDEEMDPFVTLTAAAAATKRLLLGTGICLVVPLGGAASRDKLGRLFDRIFRAAK